MSMVERTRNIGSFLVLSILIAAVYPQVALPGARFGPSFWLDLNGSFYTFGGLGYDAFAQGYLNDLWRYEVASNKWTWIGGSDAINQTGIYGTRGLASASNNPGARFDAASWTDSTGSFWLFGGEGMDAMNSTGNLNDLWRYNPGDKEWTWMNGVNTTNHPGVYETQGVPSGTTFPGGRRRCVTWIDSDNNLWLYGGVTVTEPIWRAFNDLWKYNIDSNQWTWVSGTNITNLAVTYGAKGTPSNITSPGSRYSSAAWRDSENTLWLFSGSLFVSGNYSD